MNFINRHIDHDNEELNSLFSNYYQGLITSGLSITNNRSLVEDAIQDLFLKLCENEHLLVGIKDPDSYLKVSVNREIIDKLKKLRNTSGPTTIEISVPSYEQLLINNQDSIQNSILIKEGMASLSPSQKTVLTLRFYKGLSYDEIAQKMGTTKRTVYNQVHDAIKKMRNSLSK